jgi:hypothetical protein
MSAATPPGAVRAGAQLLVAGSAILAHPEGRPAAVAELRRSITDVQAPRRGGRCADRYAEAERWGRNRGGRSVDRVRSSAMAEVKRDTHATGGMHSNRGW